MSNERRELIADWLIILGAVGLFGSLFLTWSHQFSAAFLAQWGPSDQLRGVPHDPTAWQVYSSADVLLALLAVALVGVALRGGRRMRAGALGAGATALAFILHALSVPPTEGANISGAVSTLTYVPNAPTSGVGITVAVVAVGVALLGLLLSFTAG